MATLEHINAAIDYSIALDSKAQGTVDATGAAAVKQLDWRDFIVVAVVNGPSPAVLSGLEHTLAILPSKSSDSASSDTGRTAGSPLKLDKGALGPPVTIYEKTVVVPGSSLEESRNPLQVCVVTHPGVVC